MSCNVLAIVPARGGSKGIPKKNLLKLRGKSLVEHAIRVGMECSLVDKLVLSTDDPEIAQVGQEAGAIVPFLRPARLAGDNVKTVDVVLHLLDQMKEPVEFVLLLQPTAPVRTAGNVLEAIQLLINNPDADAVISVVPLEEPHPLKIKKISGKWLVPYIDDGNSEIPRQLLPKAYKLNGAIYAIRVKSLKEQKTFLPDKSLPYVMPQETGVNIDTLLDFMLINMLLEKGIIEIG